MSIAFAVVLIATFLPKVTPAAIAARASGTPVRSFERVATYDVPGQVAEIIGATPDGETLIDTDSASEEIGFVKIGRYVPAAQQWAFYHYPLDALEASPAGSWVGLSEITWIGNDTFLVVERDNQQRDEAQVKRLYSFSVAGITPAVADIMPPVLAKTLVRDLLVQDDYRLEKIEGAGLTQAGTLLMVNDNDGAGETRLLRL